MKLETDQVPQERNRMRKTPLPTVLWAARWLQDAVSGGRRPPLHAKQVISGAVMTFQRPFCHCFFRSRAKTRPEGHFPPGDDLPAAHLVMFQPETTSGALKWS
ncbi:MAG TPA: hypothetical protein VGF90_02150, partial [Verrucomicrobiae bacterium]